jgi:hypothetical protein
MRKKNILPITTFPPPSIHKRPNCLTFRFDLQRGTGGGEGGGTSTSWLSWFFRLPDQLTPAPEAAAAARRLVVARPAG